MELAEFLLARIAEDEAPTFELIPYRCAPGCCAPAGFVGHRCLICGTEEFGGTVEAIADIAREHDEEIHRRARVLAECRFKREVVRLWNETEEGTYGDQGPTVAAEAAYALAAVYADHPDYRSEWAP